MTTYRARMVDANTGGEGTYAFEGADNLFSKTPIRIVNAFMEHIDREILTREHIDYELNAAFKHKDPMVVTAIGSLILESGANLPFMLMISPDPV